MEDQFSYDEEADDEREIRRKKLALKEQVANARAHLDGQKSKYYEDIKAGLRLIKMIYLLCNLYKLLKFKGKYFVC